MGAMSVKTCSGCRIPKPVTEFNRDRSRADGLSYRCRACVSAYLASRKDEIRETRRKWAAKRQDRQQRLMYGLAEGQYAEMLEAQGGVCAICKGTNSNGKRLAVDHCHDTGEVRGLLCNNCNGGLGFFGDDAERIRKAVAYLDQFTGLLRDAGYGDKK